MNAFQYQFQPLDRTSSVLMSQSSSTHHMNNGAVVNSTKEPPSYQRALELQAINMASQREEPSAVPVDDVIFESSPPSLIPRQQEALHKRHSYGNDSESEQLTTMTARLKKFPMIRALMQENQQSALLQQQQHQQQLPQQQQQQQQQQQHSNSSNLYNNSNSNISNNYCSTTSRTFWHPLRSSGLLWRMSTALFGPPSTGRSELLL
uniref:Uncharacterized protein n=1 Tax=Plectus sambesii TaxID=2011161 RepID=A0A914WPG9_9BILA